jgi:hypothetical protein
MAPKRDDGPGLILRVDFGRIVPATALDELTFFDLARGTELSAKPVKKPRSKARAAWWSIMGAVVKHHDRWPNPRALSNAMLLKMNCVEREGLIGDGEFRDPMSLTDFSEEQLWKLVEWAKLIIVTEIFPGVELRQITGRIED